MTESLGRSSRRELLPSLDIAARSILESQVITGTVAGVMADRALDHHWEGLFQYAAIRVGAEHGAILLECLETTLEETQASRADATLRPRENVYRHMRTLVGASPKKALAFDSSDWWTPEDSAFRGRLVELRRAFTPEEAELLELRFAHRLSSLEVAGTLGIKITEVEQIVARGLSTAERIVGRRPKSRDRTLEGALLEAFALDPRRVRAPRRRRRRPVLELGTVIANRYEVEGLLGSGAFADVYRARDREVTDHVVALKILRTPSPDARSVHVALRELQLIASVFHPSIVQLKDHGWHQDHLWFVMPLYHGETLSTRLRRGPLSRREARQIFQPLAEALATMHRSGVLHQDIKPDNVFLASLNPGPEAPEAPDHILPVLLDLGVAAKDAELVLAGTPAYFAPEVAARFAGAPDPPPVGPRADVFSLALTLRYALDPEPAENLAIGAVDAFVAFRAARAPKPPRGRELRDLRPWFERWLHFSPDGRPFADEFRRELAALTAKEERTARRLSLMRWVLPTTIAVLASFGAVVYGLTREASLQRVEATHARERAAQARERVASMSVSLTVQEARQRELQADIARLEEQYQRSRMTREQLASHLAKTESELRMVTERQAQQSQKIRQQAEEFEKLKGERSALAGELESTVARRDEIAGHLGNMKRLLEEERSQRAKLEAATEDLREQLFAVQLAATQAELRVRELKARLAVLQSAEPFPSAAQVQGESAKKAAPKTRP